MSEQQYLEEKMENVSLSVLVFRNPLIDDSASHRDQAEECFPHSNNNEYYEDSESNDDEDRYANNVDDGIPLTVEEWGIDFDARKPESVRRRLSRTKK